MGFVAAIGAEQESSAVVEPGEGALDDPAVASNAGAVFGPAAGDHRLDPPLPDQQAVLVVVVAAVSDHAVGPPPRPAGPASYRRHLIEQRQQLSDVVAITARERPGERQSGAVYEQVLLAAAAAPVDGAWTCLRAPFFACT